MRSIEVNLRRQSDLYEKYNSELSRDLIKFLIEEANIKDDVEVIVNTNFKKANLDKFIKEGLKNAYNDSKLIDKKHDNRQIIFFIIGILLLIFSTFMKQEILKEIIVIAGWVPIWDAVEISLYVDSKQKRNRKIIEKLLSSKITINEV